MISYELQHRLVVVDVKKKNLFQQIKMKWNMQMRVQILKKQREKFKDKVKELVNIEAKELWGSFKDGFWRLVKNFVGKENKGGSKEAHCGGMRSARNN